MIALDHDSCGTEARIKVVSPGFMRTSAFPGIAEELLSRYPGLERHTCENGSAHGVLGELRDTETPHLVEHLALEHLALDGHPRTTRGRTTWDFATDGPGVFRVRIETSDPKAARRALEHAIEVANGLLGG